MLSNRIVNRYGAGQPLDHAVSSAILEATQLFPDTSCGVIAISSAGEQIVHCNSRIFTVARGGSWNLPPLDAVLPCTLPVITPLCIYKDDVVKIGFLKHPTVPFQVHFQLLQGRNLAHLDEAAFQGLLLTLKDVAGVLAQLAAVPHVAMKTAPTGDAGCLFPVKQRPTSLCAQRPPGVDPPLKRVAFETGHAALLFAGRVEVYRPEASGAGEAQSPAGFFALDGNGFRGACSALYGALTLGLQEALQEALQVQSWSLTVAPSAGGGAWAVLQGAGAYSPGSSRWPAPAAFNVDGTAPLSTDLGTKVSDSQLQYLCDAAAVARARLGFLHGRKAESQP